MQTVEHLEGPLGGRIHPTWRSSAQLVVALPHAFLTLSDDAQVAKMMFDAATWRTYRFLHVPLLEPSEWTMMPDAAWSVDPCRLPEDWQELLSRHQGHVWTAMDEASGHNKQYDVEVGDLETYGGDDAKNSNTGRKLGEEKTMTDKLTPEQEKLLTEVRDEWINLALHAGDDIDYAATAKGIVFMYKTVNMPPPMSMHIVDSPAAMKALAKRLGASTQNTHWYGLGFWAGWVAFYDFFQRIGRVKNDDLTELIAYMRGGAWDTLLFEHAAIVVRRPSFVKKDDRGRLHSLEGPAVKFRDGYAVYAVGGIAVEGRIIEKPETITVDEIEKCNNAELKRVLIDRYGIGRYLEDSGAKKVSEDEYGILYRKEIGNGDEPLVMVKVANSTVEDDGTRKPYFIRVDPQIRPMRLVAEGQPPVYGEPQEPTPRNAIASTFGLRGEEYAPQYET